MLKNAARSIAGNKDVFGQSEGQTVAEVAHKSSMMNYRFVFSQNNRK